MKPNKDPNPIHRINLPLSLPNSRFEGNYYANHSGFCELKLGNEQVFGELSGTLEDHTDLMQQKIDEAKAKIKLLQEAQAILGQYFLG